MTNQFKIAVNEISLEGKLPNGHPLWTEFNDSFLNVNRDLLSLCQDISEGHAYTAQHEGRRKQDNFTMGQHIALDFDTQDIRSSISTLNRHKLATSFDCIIHTTPTHTPTAPKARMIFPLAEPVTDAGQYKAIIKTLAGAFPHADTAPTNPVSFFYGNAAATVDDIWFSDTSTTEPMPLAFLREMYRRQQRTRPAPRRAPMPTRDEPGDLGEVSAALRKVDPYSVDYNRWIGVIAALKRDFGDAAQALAVSWAAGKPGEVEKEWQRLKVDTDTNPMHINTIFQLAKGL